ncbi:oligopeptidase B [Diaminobutyricimonas aerilata]|uniref:Oligopeptidase B n=1 Tax=Diaminobutyricimonas aerilata TaxID=1162967 RepID=A0A2M9CL51_9MICO|nr:S9 family peptidase [Diaminobutyricimonas aerilata]PJJ72616.1 oligopeptidase B [Diaminobutyricimonas aerilata]
MPSTPPTADRRPIERHHHGDVFADPYEWLRDKDDPATIAYLEAENAFTAEQTDHLTALREQLFEEIRSRTQETDLTVPVREGDWWYYTRTVEGREYGIHCRAPIAGPDDWTPPALPADGSGLEGEQVLLDDNVEAEGHEFYSLGSFDVSSDGRLLLFATDTVGDERYTLRIRDLKTGAALGDEIPDTAGGALFDPSGRFVFYLTVDEAWRPDTVWRHEVGTPAADDVTVYTEPDERYWLGVGLTRSRRYLVIEQESKITSETRLLDASDPTGEFRVVWPRREGVEYSVEHAVIDGHDRLLIVHNDGALDFEVTDVAADDPQGPRRTLVPHRPGMRIEGIDAFARHLVLEYRRDALPRLAVARLDTDPERSFTWHELEFGEELFSAGAGGNPEWQQPTVRLGYTSFVTPSTVYDYDVASGELRLLKRKAVLGDYHPERYAQRREWATASDGTRVPISLVYRSDLVTAGDPAPLLLYGYGSYEHSIDPGFSIPRLSLLDRGVVFAVAHVRGGGELGRSWYEQGKTHTKKNTFTDFVACARHLVDTGWTEVSRLVAEGGSAGGLLMGAVANLAPKDFAGILASVPFVDPLTSILDPSLPLTVIEWDEWGDPLHDPEIYALMRSYSPYENVHEHGYPRILAVTSLNDTRVLYVEPAKWVARLREVGAPVLLKTEMSAGHGGVSGRYESWRERAFELAWMLDVLGVHGQAEHAHA